MFRRINNFSEALRQFTRVQQKMSNDKTVYIQRGMVYQDMGNHNFAIKDFERALELDPSYQIAFFLKGTSRLKSNQIQDAIKDFMEANKMEEDIPGVYDGLGQCHHILRNYDEALENFTSAINKAPQSIEFLKNRA